MRRAFRRLDRVIVFSSFERTLYSDYFRIPETRIDVDSVADLKIRARSKGPRVGRRCCDNSGPNSNGKLGDNFAVGSQGRDYATLLEAMRHRCPISDLSSLRGPLEL